MSIPAGVGEYCRRVGQRMHDRPRSERETLVRDLGERFTEADLTTFEACRARHGEPEAYATELRESLGLTSSPRSRWPKLVAVLLVVAMVLGGIASVFVNPAPQPGEDFSPIIMTGSGISGSSATNIAGALVLTVRQTPGDAYVNVWLTNTSDFTLDVDYIGPQSISWQGGQMMVGGPDNSEPGWVTLKDVWDPVVVLGAFNPTEGMVNAEITSSRYRPFEPFTWQPNETINVVLDGPVGACPPELAEMNPGSAELVRIDYSVGDHGYSSPPFRSQLILDDCFPEP